MSKVLISYPSSKKYTGGVIIANILFAIPLIGYAINGFFMRYSGDDYCYGDLLTRSGFWKAQWISYFLPQAYNGNRYSLTFFSDLLGSFSPKVNGISPGLVIILWLVGIIFTLYWIVTALGLPMRIEKIVLIAEILVFFTLYMAPNLSQSLYWRSGMLPYLAPIIVNTFLLGLIIKHVQSEKVNYLEIGFIICLAIVAGGFSEAATSVQVGYLSLLLISILIIQRRRNKGEPRFVKIVGIVLISSIASLLVLAISPSNSDRLMKFAQPDLLNFITISIRSTWGFIIGSLKNLPAPTFILFLISIGITWSILHKVNCDKRYNEKQYLVVIILLFSVCFFLVACSMVPSVYSQSASPEFRALIIARFVMVISIITAGAVMGMVVYQSVNVPFRVYPLVNASMLLMLGILCMYPIYAARNIYSTTSKYQRWSIFWDSRDQAIRLAQQGNILDIEVIKIDHIIPDVGELSDDPEYWYNTCAAGYYGVNTISANQPGWDDPQP